MKIHWRNIISLSLAVVALAYGIKMHHHISAFFAAIKSPGQVYYANEQQATMGFLALIAIVLSIFVIIKIICNSRR